MVGDGSGVEDTVCEWLRTKQAGHISLLLHNNGSNSKTPNRQKPPLELDISSNVSTYDLTSFEEVTDAIKEVKKKGRPIGGVYHINFAVTVRRPASTRDDSLTESRIRQKAIEHNKTHCLCSKAASRI